jgi:cyclic pyranopterin phosphate synthase
MGRKKKGLTHLDADNKARMVDVSNKVETQRSAVAQAKVKMSSKAFDAVWSRSAEKGEVLGVAQIAGISAAKRTSELIPLCHPLPLNHISVKFKPLRKDSSVLVESEVKTDAKTGVEMEALIAAAVSALTIYDMCKAMDKSIVITDLFLLQKTGGKSGTFKRKGAKHIP